MSGNITCSLGFWFIKSCSLSLKPGLFAWVSISHEAQVGGGGGLGLSIRLTKVKNLVNNASILTIFSLKSCKILENYLLTNKFFFIFWKISEF